MDWPVCLVYCTCLGCQEKDFWARMKEYKKEKSGSRNMKIKEAASTELEGLCRTAVRVFAHLSTL
jgi:Ni,Fe-hydrogenase I small subunit